MDALEAGRRIIDLMVSRSSGPVPRVRAWDGSEWGASESAGTVVLNHAAALRSMLSGRGDVGAGEGYVFGDVDLEGDIFALLEFAADLAGRIGPSEVLALRRLVRHLPRNDPSRAVDAPRLRGGRHSIERDRQAIRHHYDTGNDFFELILDTGMVYSCAHFLSPDEDLATAQTRKLDLICRKLRLQPGMRFLDVGCGWGALVIHAATHYGVDATGITVSREQAGFARRRIETAGLVDRARVLEEDYRETKGRFDAIASVGMFEHVGRRRLPHYFSCLRRLLADDGQVLNHGIVLHDRGSLPARASFVRTYVFPDGDIRPLDEVTSVALAAGFELRDLEALRPGYALTLRHWVANLERNREKVIRVAGERTYRIWRPYMAGSAVAFERATLGVVQMLLADPARPWTYGRSHLLAADDRGTTGATPSAASSSVSPG